MKRWIRKLKPRLREIIKKTPKIRFDFYRDPSRASELLMCIWYTHDHRDSKRPVSSDGNHPRIAKLTIAEANVIGNAIAALLDEFPELDGEFLGSEQGLLHYQFVENSRK